GPAVVVLVALVGLVAELDVVDGQASVRAALPERSTGAERPRPGGKPSRIRVPGQPADKGRDGLDPAAPCSESGDGRGDLGGGCRDVEVDPHDAWPQLGADSRFPGGRGAGVD